MSAPGVNEQQGMVKVEAAKPVAAPMPPPPQYATGFAGASVDPFGEGAVKILTAPVAVDEVELREDGIVYMPGVWYRRILIRAFGPGAWALLPRGPARTMGEIIVYHGALYILGRFVSEAMGECDTRFGMSYASALEGARTDCLTRCCKDLGMAAELWDPEWRDSWLKRHATREWLEPVGQQKKGRYKYTRLDAAIPGPVVAGRNSGAPAAAPVSPAPVPAPAPAPPKPNVDPKQLVMVPDPDVGIAPSEAELASMRAAAKATRWSKPMATSWLKRLFGQMSADALTRDQCRAAEELLRAAVIDDMDETYSKVLLRLESENRVLRVRETEPEGA